MLAKHAVVLITAVMVATGIALGGAAAADGPQLNQEDNGEDSGASYEIVDLSAPSTTTQGNEVTFAVILANNGDEEGNTTVSFDLGDGEVTEEEEFSVDPIAGEGEVLFNVTVDLDPGEYNWTATESQNETEMTTQIEVEEGDGNGDATPTPDETPAPMDPTPTPTPEDDPIPGFGFIVALTAILGASLLAYRRYG